MTKPSRPSRKAAFSDDEKKVAQGQDKLGDVLEVLKSRKAEPARLQSVPPLPAIELVEKNVQPDAGLAERVGVLIEEVGEGSAPEPERAAGAKDLSAAADPAEALADVVQATDSGDRRDRKSGKGTAASKQTEDGPKKPPAAWIANDVYSRLLEYSDQEKRARRSAARPFGVIAMDAIESHAAELALAWKGSGAAADRTGSLFVREINPRYRRHDLPPRAISLQGVGPENAKLLKRLKKQWGAGSVSDLVERALRLEFGMSGRQS